MKVKLFTFLVFSLLAFLPMKAFVSSDVHRVEEKKDIDLEGDMEDERNKSLLLPFDAFQVDNSEICVMSYDAHSAVTIRIMDASGTTMDTQSLSLGSQQVVSFDISSYSNGTYTLVISTPQGTYLSGMFEIV